MPADEAEKDPPLWRVEHDDGDGEDLEQEEVEQAIALYQSRCGSSGSAVALSTCAVEGRLARRVTIGTCTQASVSVSLPPGWVVEKRARRAGGTYNVYCGPGEGHASPPASAVGSPLPVLAPSRRRARKLRPGRVAQARAARALQAALQAARRSPLGPADWSGGRQAARAGCSAGQALVESSAGEAQLARARSGAGERRTGCSTIGAAPRISPLRRRYARRGRRRQRAAAVAARGATLLSPPSGRHRGEGQ